MEGQENTVVNHVSPEVLELLTEEEKEMLDDFNSKGININQYANYSSGEDDSDDDIDSSSDDEDDEEIIGEEDTSSSSDSMSSSIGSTTVLNDTNQDFSDMFSDF